MHISQYKARPREQQEALGRLFIFHSAILILCYWSTLNAYFILYKGVFQDDATAILLLLSSKIDLNYCIFLENPFV